MEKSQIFCPIYRFYWFCQFFGTLFAYRYGYMIVGLFLILIILCVNPLSVLNFLQPGSRLMRQWCLQRVRTSEPLPAEGEGLTSLYSALLCGQKLPEGQIKSTFIALGIIHLMVISGAHLIFLERIWKHLLPNFRFKNIFLTLFLLLYSMSAGLQPPVLRALFSLMLSRINKEFKLFWSPYLRVQISGLLCLFCQSSWFHSLSLQLSWIAGMGMSNHRLSRLKSCALTFILILPIVSQWSGSHPLSIILNWLASPIAGGALLPLSLLTIPFPFLRPLTDKLWGYFLNLINSLRPVMENKGIELSWTFSSFEIWIYICSVFMLLQFYFVCFLRRECVESA